MSDNARRDDVFCQVEGAAPADPTPARRRSDEALGRFDATAKRCLQLILDAIQDDPEPLLAAVLIGHIVYGTLLGLASERASPAIRERLARDAADAIARAVREAAPTGR
jgi:AcrR family transcriptional regulator